MRVFTVADDTMLGRRMRMAQDGDADAYAVVLEQTKDAFLRLARERRPAETSEGEIVRDCLLTLHRTRHTFDSGRPFSNWIEAIGRFHGVGSAATETGRAWRKLVGMLLRRVKDAEGHPTGGGAPSPTTPLER